MASKVSYKQGSKATYLGLLARNPDALYFCTDTHELFRGDDLYSDGLRIVGSYQALPTYAFAADGIIYFCKDTGCGFVLNEARDGWLPVVHGVDNDTIVINDNGLMRATYTLPIATETTLGGVKAAAATEEMTQPVGITAEGKLVTVPGQNSGGNADQSGLSATASELLITILRNGVYSTDQSANITALETALKSGGSGDDIVADDVAVADGIMTIASVGSAVSVSDGVLTIA